MIRRFLRWLLNKDELEAILVELRAIRALLETRAVEPAAPPAPTMAALQRIGSFEPLQMLKPVDGRARNQWP